MRLFRALAMAVPVLPTLTSALSPADLAPFPDLPIDEERGLLTPRLGYGGVIGDGDGTVHINDGHGGQNFPYVEPSGGGAFAMLPSQNSYVPPAPSTGWTPGQAPSQLWDHRGQSDFIEWENTAGSFGDD